MSNDRHVSDARRAAAGPTGFRPYLAVFGGIASLLGTALVATAWVIDPFFLHVSPQRAASVMVSNADPYSAWGKTRAIAERKPQVIYVGTSRVEVGLPTSHPAFPAGAAFNGALAAGSVADAAAMIEHALAVTAPDAVVVGLEFGRFQVAPGNPGFDRGLVARSARWYSLQRLPMELKQSLSPDILEETLHWITGSAVRECRSSLAHAGTRDSGCLQSSIDRAGGAASVIENDVKGAMRVDAAEMSLRAELAYPVFKQAVEKLCARSVRVRTFVHPSHGLALHAYVSRHGWAALDAWKARITDIVARSRDGGCDIRLHDFSGFDPIVAEPVPQEGGPTELRWHWEGAHYRERLGALVLSRLFDVADPALPAGFGSELTPASLPGVLARLHADEAAWAAAHPKLVVLVRQWAREKH